MSDGACPIPIGGDGPLDARKARLDNVSRRYRHEDAEYLYDFGDGRRCR